MTAEIVNLNTYRKAKRKARKKQNATAKRAKFGRDKAEQRRMEYEKSRHEAGLDGAQREDDGGADK